MYTQIGIVSGRILELLEQRNGVLVFGEIHSSLNEAHDLVVMSLGWLLQIGCVCIIEDPLRAIYQSKDREKVFTNEAYIFDLVVGNNVTGAFSKRMKNMHEPISMVAGKVLTLLEGCGDLLNLQTIETLTMHGHRDIVLMGLGYLIREGYVRGTAGTSEFLIFRLPKELIGSDLEAFCHV